MAQDYNNTLNLPVTEFNMRGALPQREPAWVEEWEEKQLYHKMIKKNEGKPQYILHDGPPYANGDIHLGTALNKVLKDFIIRQKNMSGYQAPYIPGWDTHGLPIELKARKKAGVSSDIGPVELRKICKEFALHYLDSQRTQFKRLGTLGEWENPYMTLKPEFEAKQIEIFGNMAQKGYIYKGLKPVYWCPDCNTALAEAEIEYEEDPCFSIYVKFPVKDDQGKLGALGVDPAKTFFVIWTTTTWTLPGNMAVCLGPDYEYCAVHANGEYYIMAKELADAAMKAAKIEDYELIGSVKGKDLEYIVCAHPFLDRDSLVIVGDHVTLDSGTGCVHTAPGHGVEDFEVCVNHYPQIPIVVPVDNVGKLTKDAGEFEGLTTDEANKAIAKKLEDSNLLFAVEKIVISIHTAGDVNIQSSTVQPNSGSARWRISKKMQSVKSKRLNGFRDGVKVASRTWSPTAPTGVSPVRDCGVFQFQSSTAKNVENSTSTSSRSKQFPTCSAKKARMHGGPMKLRKSFQREPNVKSADAKNSEKKPTSWTFGLTPVPAMQLC